MTGCPQSRIVVIVEIEEQKGDRVCFQMIEQTEEGDKSGVTLVIRVIRLVWNIIFIFYGAGAVVSIGTNSSAYGQAN